jgi:hypothetical protein
LCLYPAPEVSWFYAHIDKIAQNNLPMLFFGAGLPQIARLTGDAKTYSERLFDFPEVDRLDQQSAYLALTIPAKNEGVYYTDEALELIFQVWGSHIWELSKASPISQNDVVKASKRAIEALDCGFFKVRIDRLTERQIQYVLAMAQCDALPTTSTKVADILGIPVTKAAPGR